MAQPSQSTPFRMCRVQGYPPLLLKSSLMFQPALWGPQPEPWLTTPATLLHPLCEQVQSSVAAWIHHPTVYAGYASSCDQSAALCLLTNIQQEWSMDL